MADPFAPLPPASGKKARRPSDLPADLSQFDMLGLSSVSPPVVQPAPVAAPAPAPFHVNTDPFPSFPHPINPVLSVAAQSPIAASPVIATPQKRMSASSPAGLIAPPPSSTRHRKDSAARKGSDASMGHAPVTPSLGLAPSPKVTLQTPAKPSDSLLDLDLLMESNPPNNNNNANNTIFPPAYPSVIGHSPAAAAPINVFDSFAASNPVEISSSPQRQVNPNPFLAFDEPEDADPFAAIATRTPNPSTMGSVPKQNAFEF